MGFEDSMIEDGFHDEKEYLEHLMDEANTEENELDSTCGISDEELTRRFVEAVRIENEIKEAIGCPIPVWDEGNQKAYLQYPDGHREYASQL